MTRIPFLSSRASDNERGDPDSALTGWPRFARHDLQISSSQLQLDAALDSFASQSTDIFSIASMTAAGLVGKLARLGILSAFSRISASGGPLQIFISHLGSVAAEAATITGINLGQARGPAPTEEFFKNFINFGGFRLFHISTQNSVVQHFVQSAALMAGHQVSTSLGLEEVSQKSFTEQFFDANLTTLQIGVGSALASRVVGGRLQRMERNWEQQASFSFVSSELSADLLYSSSANEGNNGGQPPSPRRGKRGETPVMERLSGPPNPILPNAGNPDRPQANKEIIRRFHQTVSAYTNIFRAGFVMLGVNRSVATPQDVFNIYENLYKSIPPSQTNRTFPWKGFLASYLRSFSEHIQQAEGMLERDPEVDSLRDTVIDIHDQLMLLQEALNIFQRHQRDFTQDELGLLQFAQQAHEGLRLDRKERQRRLTVATHNTGFMVSPEHQQHWTDLFVGQKPDPRIAYNVSIIMGNVTLVAAEYVGGSFYRALAKSPLINRVYRVVSFYYDMQSGQLLAFGDRSEISAVTLENFRRRNRQVGEGRFFVDVEEFGSIVSVQLDDPEHTRATARERVQHLQGLYVVLPPGSLSEVEGVNETGKWKVIPSQRTRLVPGEHTSAFYRILGIAHPESENRAHLSLLTLNPYDAQDASQAFQLWIPRTASERFDSECLVIVSEKPAN